MILTYYIVILILIRFHVHSLNKNIKHIYHVTTVQHQQAWNQLFKSLFFWFNSRVISYVFPRLIHVVLLICHLSVCPKVVVGLWSFSASMWTKEISPVLFPVEFNYVFCFFCESCFFNDFGCWYKIWFWSVL